MLGVAMSTQAPSPPSSRRAMVVRLVGASFICLLILAITGPDLGSVTLPNHKIGYGWKDAICVSIIVAPLIPIFIGASFSRAGVEYLGWALLLILLVVRFMR